MKRKILVAALALMACVSQAVWTGSTPASRTQLPGVRMNPPILTPAIQERPDVPPDIWVPVEEPAKPLSYFVQAGIFSKLMRALLLVAAIEPKFPQAVISTRHSAGADRYQVRIGPFRSRTDAEAAVDWLASLGHSALILRLAPSPATNAKKGAARKQLAFRIDP